MYFDLTIPARSVQNDNLTYYVKIDDEEDGFPIAIFGKNSYCAGIRMESGLGTSDDHLHNVQVGKYTSIGNDVLMEIDQNHDYRHIFQGEPDFCNWKKEDYTIHRKGQILIGNDCWIGARAIILSGSTIHNGAVIGAGAVVSGEIPPYAIVVGNPARVIKYRFSQEIIDGLQRIQWWNWPEDILRTRSEDFRLSVEDFVKKYLSTIEKDSIYSSFKINRMTEVKVPRYLYFTDYDQPYAITDHVMHEFVKTYHDRNAELVLYCPADSEFYEYTMSHMGEIFDRYSDADSLVNIVDQPIESEVQLIAEADCLITNRSPNCMRRCEIAYTYGKKVLSGVDLPIF